jgi:hypothetical protein
MSGLPEHGFPAFFEAEAKLRQLGFDVENPAEKGIIDGWSWADYLKYDLQKMMECDAICLLPGWESSRGARLEYHVAKELGLKEIGYSLLEYWPTESWLP